VEFDFDPEVLTIDGPTGKRRRNIDIEVKKSLVAKDHRSGHKPFSNHDRISREFLLKYCMQVEQEMNDELPYRTRTVIIASSLFRARTNHIVIDSENVIVDVEVQLIYARS
jgi:hypothetical protein